MVLHLPHGGGKHGRNATETDECRWNTMALRMLAAQNAGTRLWRCGQGSAAQGGGGWCKRGVHGEHTLSGALLFSMLQCDIRLSGDTLPRSKAYSFG